MNIEPTPWALFFAKVALAFGSGLAVALLC